MRLLDLFCGAGGAAVGYYHAGFDEIVGVDHKPQPRYPFEFVQADAIEYCREHGSEFGLIHASPPCQRFSVGAILRGTSDTHPDLIADTRDALLGTGIPYVIENVRRAPLNATMMLCGTMFGLGVIRHRNFEIFSILSVLTPPCNHQGTVKGGQYVTVAGHGGDGCARYDMWCEAMGIDWMTKKELTEAVPPAYTEWLGRRILAALQRPIDLDEVG